MISYGKHGVMGGAPLRAIRIDAFGKEVNLDIDHLGTADFCKLFNEWQ